MKKILFLGLGNPILSDDAVGIHVVKEIERILGMRRNTRFMTGSFAGLHLLDAIQGYDEVIIVDALEGNGTPGTLRKVPFEEMPATRNLSSFHSMNLMTAMRWGKDIGMNLPTSIAIYGIETHNVTAFSERMSSDVERRVPENARKIIAGEVGEAFKDTEARG
jgi:hydrogenase maturation protease